jgi:hypothetical protein
LYSRLNCDRLKPPQPSNSNSETSSTRPPAAPNLIRISAACQANDFFASVGINCREFPAAALESKKMTSDFRRATYLAPSDGRLNRAQLRDVLAGICSICGIDAGLLE